MQAPREMQPSSVSNPVIINNESGNCFNSQMNSQNLSRSTNHSSLPGEITAWRIPDDRRTNQQASLWNQPSDNHGLSNTNMIEQGVPQRDTDGSQTMLQNLSSDGNISPKRMALEHIDQNLMSNDAVVNVVEEDNLLSVVNTFSCLLGQASAPLSQSSYSQAINTLAAPPPPHIEPTEVINLDTPGSNSVDELFPPWMESPSLSLEMSPEEIAFLSGLLP